MVFWGIEVKPGKPVTHSSDRTRGKLRISQATLAIGSSTKKGMVQCNVGDMSPVLLCTLLPDKTESLQLDLEFEEAVDVVFSVIGPRSIYLTGYFVGIGRHSNLNDESESYGEDIANTETEESVRGSDEDEYDDSFINDDDNPEVFAPSPVSSSGVDEEIADINKSSKRKDQYKRLKKRYQSVDSDDDPGSEKSEKQNTVDDFKSVPESEGEDEFPISSLYKNKRSAKSMIPQAAEEKAHKETVETGNKIAEDGDTRAKTDIDGTHIVEPKGETVVDDDSKRSKPKKKGKEFYKEGKTLDADSVDHKPQQDEAKANNIGHELLVSDEQDHKPTPDKRSELPSPSTELSPENNIKQKKKRKERSKEHENMEADTDNHINPLEEKDDRVEAEEEGSENGSKAKKRRKKHDVKAKPQGNSSNHSSVLEEGQAKQDEEKPVNINKALHLRREKHRKPTSVKDTDIDSVCLTEKKTERKKKKKSKLQDNVNIEIALSSKEEKSRSVKEFEPKSVDDNRSSQVRNLSNGLIIEELESGNSDGKKAAPGRKVKIYYSAMLKESGRIFDSNFDKAPYKFRLGDEEIIEGWNVGLDGMRAGNKRRLTIPPSMGYGRQRAGENIPPNSWLVYEVKLLSVR